MKKRILSLLTLCSILFFNIIPLSAASEPEKSLSEPPELVNVGTACVYNIENDRYIFSQDIDKKIAPASTVKLMTAIVAVEALGDKSVREAVTVTKEALRGVSGNRIGLKADEIVTVDDLLYALICGGANDAANVLAHEVAGSTEAFVKLMNDKAKELGANDTYYTNPTGMDDPEMFTTTRDVVTIAAYAYKLDPICDISSVSKFTIPETNKSKTRTVYNKNYYFANNIQYIYKWDVPRGLNAGYTEAGGSCIVTTGNREGLTYIVAVMGALSTENYIYSYTEAAKLLNWAFDAYSYVDVLTTSDMICELPVKLSGKVDYVTLFPSENVKVFLPRDIDVEHEVEVAWKLSRDYFTAPVNKGEVGGEISVSYGGMDLGTYELITGTDVSRDNFLYVLDLMRGFTRTAFFKVAVTAVVVAVVGYVGACVYVRVFAKPKKRR